MDALVEEAGGWGRFQLMMTSAIAVSKFAIACSMMHMAFGGLVPDWWCLPSDAHRHGNSSLLGNGRRDLQSQGANYHHGNWTRDNVTFQACNIPESDGMSCKDHLVFDQSVRTVVNEWSLVCELSHVKPLMTSLQMVGVLAGALIGGQASDTFGRRLTLYIASLCHVIAALVGAFSSSWEMFMALRVVIGLTIGVSFVSNFSLPIEFVGPKWRQVVTVFPGWNMGTALFALAAWLLHDWSYLHIVSAAIGVPFLLTWPFMPESARWLATKGRLEEAEAVVERVARVNGRPKPPDTLARLRAVAEVEREAGQGRRYTYLHVYKGWRMALISLVLNFAWFSLSFSYYGISFGVSALSGNVYLNIFLMTIVEIPSNFSTVFLYNRLGRRWTCFMFFVLSSAASFGIFIADNTAPEEQVGRVKTALAMVSKLSVASAWLAVMTFTSEQYPTVIRNLGYGASNTMARVGGALAPVLLNMDTDDDVTRGFIVVGSVMAFSGLACLGLRETKDQGLQDSIFVEVKDAGKGRVKAGCSSERDERGSGATLVWTVKGDPTGVEKSDLYDSKNGNVSIRF